MKSQAHGVDINSKTFVKVDEVEITRYSNQWHLISVPFVIPIHPLEDEKPKSPEEVINHDYIDDITIRITICFTNDYLRKYVKGKKGDRKYFQYYQSEVKYLTMSVNRNEKKAHFFFPKMIADKNEYGSVPSVNGYVIEMMYKDQEIELENNVVFEGFRDDEILKKFKDEALSKGSENENILIPAHLVDPALLSDVGPVHYDY